ncbi:hypothetical protein N8569_00415 [bacterium]|jgi:hypothetical protein|nr:hypothetical protein [bacterium]
MFGLKNDEILTYFLLIIVGYCIAKMFSRRCEGFSVGVDSNSNYYVPKRLNRKFNPDTCFYGCGGLQIEDNECPPNLGTFKCNEDKPLPNPLLWECKKGIIEDECVKI